MRAYHRDGDSRNDVVVFGFGRSGTTWLAQILAAAGLELVFEPLRPDHIPEVSSWKPLPLFYRAGERFPWAGTFDDLMAGRIRNEGMVRQNPGAARRVFKFIRANLLAEWILDRYPVNGVFIVRNPLAVVASMRKEEWTLSAKWIAMLLGDRRFGEFFDRHPGVRELAGSELTDAQARAVFWGISNLIPREIGLWDRIPLVVYDHMCRDPEGTVRELAPRLGVPVTAEVLAQCHRPSFMSGRRPGGQGYDPTTAWRSRLSSSEIGEIVDVAERFGLCEFVEGA